jgi:hypothetical protein
MIFKCINLKTNNLSVNNENNRINLKKNVSKIYIINNMHFLWSLEHESDMYLKLYKLDIKLYTRFLSQCCMCRLVRRLLSSWSIVKLLLWLYTSAACVDLWGVSSWSTVKLLLWLYTWCYDNHHVYCTFYFWKPILV